MLPRNPEEMDPNFDMNTDGLIATLSGDIRHLTAAISLLREEIHSLTGRVTALEAKALKEEGREEARKELQPDDKQTWWSMLISNPTALICVTIVACAIVFALGGTGILALIEEARKAGK
jgi:hypothetical protein